MAPLNWTPLSGIQKGGMSRSMKSYKKQWKDQFKEWMDYYEKNKEKKKNQEVLIVQ